MHVSYGELMVNFMEMIFMAKVDSEKNENAWSQLDNLFRFRNSFAGDGLGFMHAMLSHWDDMKLLIFIVTVPPPRKIMQNCFLSMEEGLLFTFCSPS